MEDGGNGYVVPTGDARAFGEALACLVGDPARLAAFGEASRQQATRFTIDGMVDRTLAAYRASINRTEAAADLADDVDSNELLASA